MIFVRTSGAEDEKVGLLFSRQDDTLTKELAEEDRRARSF